LSLAFGLKLWYNAFMMKPFVTQGRAYKMLQEAFPGELLSMLRNRRALHQCGVRRAIAMLAKEERAAKVVPQFVVAIRVNLW
jgi:hypothetical protein